MATTTTGHIPACDDLRHNLEAAELERQHADEAADRIGARSDTPGNRAAYRRALARLADANERVHAARRRVIDMHAGLSPRCPA